MKKNVWLPVAGFPELHIGQYIVPNFVSNTVAIEISPREFVVISPGAPLLAAWHEQFPQATQLHLLFPNGYHHMGVNAWLEDFPNAKLYASTAAIKQLKQKGFGQAPIKDIEHNSMPLPKDYYLRLPPGHRAGDVWIGKQSSETGGLWITCDSFLNYERLSNQPMARLLQRCLGAAPGLKISQVVKWFILNDRQRFKHWALQQLMHDKPTTLIPSHGEIKTSDTLFTQLEVLLKSRL